MNVSTRISVATFPAVTWRPSALRCPSTARSKLDPLLPRLLAVGADGRFGREDLDFSAAAIRAEHMALLWGNGRLLTGLLAQIGPGPSQRFWTRPGGSEISCCDPWRVLPPGSGEAAQGMGAKGLICFTQLVEPLTLLGQATGDRRYSERGQGHCVVASSSGRATYPRLPGHAPWNPSAPRGDRRSGPAPTHRRPLRRPAPFPRLPRGRRRARVLRGADKNLSPEDLRKLWTLDTKDPQDEGCAEADLVRLGLHSWR